MGIKSSILFLAFLSSVGLALFVLFHNYKSSLNRVFTFNALAVAAWSLSNSMILLLGAQNDRYVVFFGNMAFASVSLLPAGVLNFAISFPRHELRGRIRGQVWLVGGTALLFAGLSFSKLITRDIQINPDGSQSPILGPAFPIFLLYGLACAIQAGRLLYRKYRTALDIFERLQIRYLVYNLCAPSIALLVGYPLAANFGQFNDANITTIAPLVGFVSLAACAYAIVRYRLMDITVVYRHTVVYTLMIVCLTAILATLLYLFENVLGSWLQLRAFTVILITSATVATGMPFLKKALDRFVETKLLGRPFDYQASLSHFTSKMTTVLELEALQNLIVGEIMGIMRVASCALLEMNEKMGRFEFKTGFRWDRDRFEPTWISLESPLIQKIGEERSVLVRYEMKRRFGPEMFPEIAANFDRLDAELLIPVMNRNEFLGILTLGPKKSGDIFSAEDIALLTTLGNQFAAAWDNAKLHQRITSLKNHFENILINMTSGVIVVDEERKITTFNKRAEQILELKASSALGKSFECLPGAFAEALGEALREDARFIRKEAELERPHGPKTIIGYSASSFVEKEGGKVAMIIFSDVTLMKSMEASMRQAERMKAVGMLAAGMAHEIKNPLVSIKTMTDLLPTRYNDVEFHSEFIPIVAKEADRINSLVNRLLNFARPRPSDFRETSIKGLIDRTLLGLSEDFRAKKIRVVKRFLDEDIRLPLDGEQMHQAFLNLFLNGTEAMGEQGGGILTIGMDLETLPLSGRNGNGRSWSDDGGQGKTLVVSIADSGPGISENEIDQIFNPFYTTKSYGTGLGLSIVHRILQEHEGRIEVRSREGDGATFFLYLPLAREAALSEGGIF